MMRYFWRMLIILVAGCIYIFSQFTPALAQNVVIPANTVISQDTTWTRANSPYVVDGVVRVAGTATQTATLTIEAGVEVRFRRNGYLQIGVNGRGALNVRGSVPDPIRFTAEGGQSGGWQGILFGAQTDSSTTVENAVIEYVAQGGRPAIEIVSSAPTLLRCIIRLNQTDGIVLSSAAARIENSQTENNSGYGLVFKGQNTATLANNQFRDSARFENAAGGVSLTGNTIVAKRQFPLRIPANLIGILFANNTVQGLEQTDYIEIADGSLFNTATWPAREAPYYAQTEIAVGANGSTAPATLTLEPGVRMLFGPNGYMRVGGSAVAATLIAAGSRNQPIIFTTASRQGQAGDWQGLIFGQQTQAATRLEHLEVHFAGRNHGGAIDLTNTTLNISDALITNSGGYGVKMQSNARGVFTRLSIDKVADDGIRLQDGQLTLSDSQVRGSAKYGLYMDRYQNLNVTNTAIEHSLYLWATDPSAQIAFTGNTIDVAPVYPLRVNANALGSIVAGNTYNRLGESGFIEVLAQRITRDATWPALDVPYRISGSSLEVGNNSAAVPPSTLTLLPGAVLQFNPGLGMTVGNTPGALVAIGTVDKPIVFTSAARFPRAGDWNGLSLVRQTQMTTRLEQVQVLYAGRQNGAALDIQGFTLNLTGLAVRESSSHGIRLSAGAQGVFERIAIEGVTQDGVRLESGQLTLNNSVIEDVGQYGLFLNNYQSITIADNRIEHGVYLATNDANALATFNGNSISVARFFPLRLNANAVGVVLSNSNLTGLDQSEYIEVFGGSISRNATWPELAVPYLISNQPLTVGSNPAATLTLEPGARLEFNARVGVIIGNGANALGALVAIGTADKPIVFTSAARFPRPGDWNGLLFGNQTQPNTQLEHAQILYAGGQNQSAVGINNTALSLTDVVIRDSAEDGIEMSNGSRGTFTRLVIEHVAEQGINIGQAQLTLTESEVRDAGEYGLFLNNHQNLTLTDNRIEDSVLLRSFNASTAVVISSNTITPLADFPLTVNANVVGRLFANNTITGLRQTPYVQVTGQDVIQDAFWPALDVPYFITSDDIRVGDASSATPISLTLEAGSIFLFERNRGLRIGESAAATLIARGSAEAPIRFTSADAQPLPSYWKGIYFGGKTTDTSILDHAIIEYTTSNVSLIGGSPIISNNLMQHSSSHGVYATGYTVAELRNNQILDSGEYGVFLNLSANLLIDGNTIEHGLWSGDKSNLSQPIIVNNTFINYQVNYPVWIPLLSISADLRGNRFEGTTSSSYIALYGTQSPLKYDLTLPNVGLPYRIINSELIVDGGTLFIEAGVELRFDPGLSLDVRQGGRLFVQGTATAPVVFTASTTNAHPGDWKGISFDSQARSVLEYCEVNYAGSDARRGSIQIYDSRTSETVSEVRHCLISQSASHGIVVDRAQPVIYASRFVNNNGFDLFNTVTGRRTTTARLNWWGSASGPAGIGDASGNKVSDGVDILPWLTTDSVPPVIENLQLYTPRFNPAGGQGVVAGRLSQPQDWQLTIRNAANTQVATINGSGRDIRATWQGINNGTALPNGDYPFTLVLTASDGSTSEVRGKFTLDGSLPVATITSPAVGATVTAGNLEIRGNAAITGIRAYKLEYAAETTPNTWQMIVRNLTSTPVQGLLHTWNAVSLARGNYLLRLTVEGPQSSVSTVIPLVLDSISITDFALSGNNFDPSSGQNIAVTFRLSNPANVTVEIGEHKVVNNAPFAAGVNTVNWNGRDANGNVVANGAYFVVISAKDTAGRTAVYTDPAIITPIELPISSFIQNEVDAILQITYQLPQPSIVSLRVSKSPRADAVQPFMVLASEPRSSGEQAEIWQYGTPQSFPAPSVYHVPTLMIASTSKAGGGGGGGGAVASASIFFMRLTPPPPPPPPKRINPRAAYLAEIKAWALPANVIIINVKPFDVKPIFTEPATFKPSWGQVSEIKYELSHAARVTVGIYQPGAGGLVLVRTLLTDVEQVAGKQSVIWDGRYNNRSMAKDGQFIYVITVTSPTGVVKTRRGSIRVVF